MATCVEEDSYLIVCAAPDDDGVLAHRAGDEIPRARDLGFVGDKQPTAGKDPLQLALVHLGVDEDARADQPLVGVNESVYRGIDHGFLDPSRSIDAQGTRNCATCQVPWVACE